MPSVRDHNPTNKDMAAMLEQALPPAQVRLLHLIAAAAAERGLPLYIIGGFVRDLFLGQPGLDFDLVVVGDAVAFARMICKTYGGKVTLHTQFGTATWQPNFESGSKELSDLQGLKVHLLDFVTARSETYAQPGALPTVRPGSLTDDLCRRDFSINTLALRLEGEHFGELHDELGGMEDLGRGTIRVLHPGSYVDDPTRIMRAVRYEQRYGFKIAATDLKLIAEAKALLGGLSGERLRHELDLMLMEANAAGMLGRLQELDLLIEIQPQLSWKPEQKTWLAALSGPEPEYWKDIPDLLHLPRRISLGYLLWLGHLEAEAITELASRLDFTAGLREALLALSALYKEILELVTSKPSQVVERLVSVPPLAVGAAWISGDERTRQVLEKYLSEWRFVEPKTTGYDLIARGMKPGPAFKNILAALKAAWLDGEVRSESEELFLLEKLIN